MPSGHDTVRPFVQCWQVLQLEDVRRQLVGDGGARGISGGQRKRVNLGLELVAAPALLLLGGSVLLQQRQAERNLH